jgi:hypothetical protein
MRAIDGMPEPDERTFTGGVRTRSFNATYPLARLRIGGSGVRLTCMGFWRRSWTWEDLQAIEEVRGVLMSPWRALRSSEWRPDDLLDLPPA